MRLLNKHLIPKALYSAVAKAYLAKPGDPKESIRMTRLIDSPQVMRLTRLHWEEIEQDSSEGLWALLGSAVHAVAEKHAPADALVEEKLTGVLNGVLISGTPDLYENGVVEDYKVTSVWAFLHGSAREKWEQQLNGYAWLYEQSGFEVRELVVNAILRDWQRARSVQDDTYPPIPFLRLPLPLWEPERRVAFIRAQLQRHLDPNAICSDEERWKKEDIFAVKKTGNKRPSPGGLCASEAEAISKAAEWTREKNAEYIVERRPGGYKRCEEFCPVAAFCPQYEADRPASSGAGG